MATINIKCPVCGDILDNGVCPKCGYLLIVFPEVVPGAIKEAEKKRVDAAKGMANKLNKLEKDFDKCHEETTILQQTVNDQKRSIARLDEELHKINGDYRVLLKVKERVESTLSEREECLREARIFSETLKEQNRSLTTDLAKARDEISQLHRSAKAGNVYFILDDDGEFSVIPVQDNKQFYATGPGIESCRISEDSITMLPVMTTAKVAFSVEKSMTGGYSLTDLAGTLTSSGASKGNKMRLTQGVTLKISGNSFKLYFCINQD